jgi:hypothetical protein
VRGSVAPRRKNAPRPAEKSAPTYLQWLRGRPCFLDNADCGYAKPRRKSLIEAAHVDHGGDKGMSTKVSDRWAIPLCQHHHDEQHGKVGRFRDRGGWKTFEAKYGFSAVAEAARYWRLWPQSRKWEQDNL